jgi:hypothetical protein
MRQECAHARLNSRPYNGAQAQHKIDMECNSENREKVEKLQKDSKSTIQEAIFPVSHPHSDLPF